MHATSPSNGPPILIAAVSGRALAAAARRAGYHPLVADFFCDTDTRALAQRCCLLPGSLHDGIDGTRLVEALQELAGEDRPAALVLGSGFEREPDLVDALARHFPLAGNNGAAIRRIKDPQQLSADCFALGIPHPAIQHAPPSDPENWMVKQAGGAGGNHVKPARDDAASSGRYFQRFVAGQSVSVLFVANGSRAEIVGFSRQWTSPSPDAPFRYGGAVRLRRVDAADARLIGTWLDGLTSRAGLVGLCSADFIRNAGGYHLLEINPRPGATLDIFDSLDAPLMEAHLRAARGEAFALPRFHDAMASMIAYAAAPVPEFPQIPWPDWTADHQSPGTRLDRGDPVCTIFARGPNAGATRKRLRMQAAQLQRCWEGIAK